MGNDLLKKTASQYAEQHQDISEAYLDGFRHAMSLVESHSTHEHLSGRMTDETYKFMVWITYDAFLAAD